MAEFIVSLLALSTALSWLLVASQEIQIDRARFEEGRKQFELVQRQAEMPQYGQCWRDAMITIQNGCKQLSDATQARLALAYLNCFLQIQGRATYECESNTDIKTCLHSMRDADRSSLTTFFTHTQNICYFLQSQVWQENTETTIHRLALTSSQVAEQLESAHKLQADMLSSQNLSLNNQEKLMEQTDNLNNVITASSQNVRHLFEDLKRSTQEQKEIIGNLFDQLSRLQTTILGEVSGFYSVVFYFLSILVSYLLTSTPRTSGGRVWLFLIMTINTLLEQTMACWIPAYLFSLFAFDSEEEQQYWLQKQCRRFSVCLSVLVLCACAYLYQDINAVNNKLLVEIRKQNSDMCRFITGKSGSLLSQSTTDAQLRVLDNEEEESTDSDYTSHGEEDSETDSDKTFILPENQPETDAESFLTVQEENVSLSDRSSLLSELRDLRNATPVRELASSVMSWLDSSVHMPDKQELPANSTSNTPVCPYSLRPRTGRPSPKISPATRVESAKSFSRTVHQMQQVSEKNSRLLRIYQSQHPDNLKSSNENSR